MRYHYLVYLLALVPAFIFRDFTPDNELKYISIVDEALRNDTWFTFFNHGEAYADKPPLYFWLLMLARLVTGGYHMWLMGLFSLLPAVGVMAVMDRWMRLEKVRHNAQISNLMLGTTVMFVGSALVLRMDMLMTFFIVLSLYTFFRIYKGMERPRERWLLPVWVFLAIFSKGPMGILIPLASMLAFLGLRKQIRLFFRWFGWRQWLVLAGLCAVWFGLVYMEGGKEYLNNILFKQTVGRGVNSFHHRQHLFYYLPRLFYTFAPWSLLYLTMIWLGVRRKLFITDTEKFFYTTAWVNLVMLSLISSKLDIYLLPIYPFVVYLASAMLSRTGGGRAARIGTAVPAAIFALLWLASFFAAGLIPFEYDSLLMLRAGLAVASLAGLFGLLAIRRNRIGNAIRVLGWGMLGMIFLAAFNIPQLNRGVGFAAMAGDARKAASEQQAGGYAYYNYRAFSDMDVFLGEELIKVATVGQLDSLDALPGKTIVFMRDRDVSRNEDLKNWMQGRTVSRPSEGHYWLIVGAKPETPDIDNVPE